MVEDEDEGELRREDGCGGEDEGIRNGGGVGGRFVMDILGWGGCGGFSGIR